MGWDEVDCEDGEAAVSGEARERITYPLKVLLEIDRTPFHVRS
jgi:hypothetical protein